MSSGAKQLTRYGVETTAGVAATKWQTLGVTSNSLDATAQTTESQTIKDTRIAAGTLVTGVEIAGDIETEFAWVVQDVLLEVMALNPFVNNILTFGGKVRKSLSVIRGFDDVDNFQLFLGCFLNTWTLSVTDQGIVTSKFSIMGMGRVPSDKLPTGTNTPALDETPFTSQSMGDILIDGVVKEGMCASQLELTIDNSMQVQKCLGKKENNGIGAILETIMKGSGSITIAWSKNTAALYEKQFLNQSIGIEWPLIDSAGNKYIIKLPKVLLSAPLPSGGGADLLTTQFSFTVADVAPTLTRVPFTPPNGG